MPEKAKNRTAAAETSDELMEIAEAVGRLIGMYGRCSPMELKLAISTQKKMCEKLSLKIKNLKENSEGVTLALLNQNSAILQQNMSIINDLAEHSKHINASVDNAKLAEFQTSLINLRKNLKKEVKN